MIDIIKVMAEWVAVPKVALPPIFILPKRRKGRDSVTISGVTLRMTMTLSGFLGMSLSDMFAIQCLAEL